MPVNIEAIVALILIGVLEVMIFTLPARFPRIKQKALMNRKWRWQLIVLLGILPILLHFWL